jgi:hypothetical protein
MAVDGTYNINLETPMGNRPGKLTLKTDGGSLSGTFTAEGAENTFTGGTVSGEEIAFSVQVSTPMGQITLNFKGTVSGDAISGQVQAGEFGSFPLNGTRA